ncbi:MAG: hypothetical protein ACI9EF_000866 [Pseudohongiellaceae bacterium]|jgi:hypothetical protein
MTTDLSGLEATAAQQGLGSLRARVVPSDRRRGCWFRWTASELLVSERVLERLRPEEGQALLVHAVIEQRHLRRSWDRWFVVLVAVAVAVWFVIPLLPYFWMLAPSVAFLVSLVALAVLRAAANEAADDEAVLTVSDAELLVRSLNTIQKDELRLGKLQGNARPDLHRRAERLVTLHQLRLPPELRTVPVVGNCSTSCSESAAVAPTEG